MPRAAKDIRQEFLRFFEQRGRNVEKRLCVDFCLLHDARPAQNFHRINRRGVG